MEDKELLIVGIDPGTTTGCAIIDVKGNLVHLNSSKNFDLNLLISETINFGKIVLVGTDKANVPSLVKAFATKVGARIVSPKHDLKVEEKKDMAGSFDFGDEHQADALASALFAYKESKAMLDKVDFFAAKNKKSNILDEIKELVITKKISIRNAASIIENKDEESKIIEKAAVQKKLDENDFLRLYSKMKKFEAEIKLVKKYNNRLKNNIRELEKENSKKLKPKDENKWADFREKRIIFMDKVIKSKDNEILRQKFSIKKLHDIMSNINDYYVLKKLKTLGANEFDFKNKILKIKQNDILIVEDPNIASNSVIEMLKGKVFVIIHDNPVAKKAENSLPFIFINSKNLKIDGNEHFGFIEKRHFEAEKSRADWVGKIIDEYKREKLELISR